MTIKEWIHKVKPAIDIKGRFLFFFNRRAAFTSVARKTLGTRVIIHKDNPKAYMKKLNSIPDAKLKRMFRFTIVRNPYHRLVSSYFRMIQRGSKTTRRKYKYLGFDRFVLTQLAKDGTRIHNLFHEQWPNAFLPNGKKYIHYIAKLENIKEDWKPIARKLHVSSKLIVSNKSKHYGYKRYYKDPKVAKAVEEIYARDLELFNYSL